MPVGEPAGIIPGTHHEAAVFSQGNRMKTRIGNGRMSVTLALGIFLALDLQAFFAFGQGTGNWNNLVTNWVQTAAPNEYWSDIACSSDGSHLVGTAAGGGIYTSTNSGATWNLQNGAPNETWQSVASSADGTHLAAVVNGGGIYTSTDSGTTWTFQAGAPSTNWQWVACSSDGTHLAAINGGGFAPGGIWTSVDGGVTWNQETNAPNEAWHSIASSSNGSNLVAVVFNGGIWTSSDAGATWTSQASAPGEYWYSVASSANGNNLVAAVIGVGIWTSTNSGTTWTQATNAPAKNWEAVASSADGSKLAAVAYGQGIWISTNSGTSWVQTDAPGNDWWAAACSADGSKMFAGVYYGGGIWTAQTEAQSTAPRLYIRLSGKTVTVYWQNVSGWTLFQNSNIAMPSGWTPAGAPTLLNGTNYLNMNPVGGNMFFRLENEVPAPRLNISISGETVTVYWQNVSGWNLYQNTDLAMPSGWVPSGAPTLLNGTNYLRITPAAGNMFFTLKP